MCLSNLEAAISLQKDSFGEWDGKEKDTLK